MRIIVNHVSRMSMGHICAAGIQQDGDKCVRPVGGIGERMMAWEFARTFRLGNEVDCGEPRHARIQRPHVEDRRVNLSELRVRGRLQVDGFWRLLSRIAKDRLCDIFGSALQSHGGTCVRRPGRGNSSLGCLRVSSAGTRPALSCRGNDVRLQLDTDLGPCDIKVNDLRFYYANGEWGTKSDLVQRVGYHIRGGETTILGVGLTRPWQEAHGGERLCWLQITGIFLEGNPYLEKR